MLGGGCAIEIHEKQNKKSITLFKYPGNEPYLMASILKLVFIRTQPESIDKIASALIDEFGFERVSRLNRRAVMYFYDLAIAKDFGGVLTIYKKENSRFRKISAPIVITAGLKQDEIKYLRNL